MYRQIIILIAILPMIMGCTEDFREAQGFSLPEGNIDQGRSVYLEKGCQSCHVIDGMDRDEANTEASIRIGDKNVKVKTYGELVTSVINPSHRIAANWPGARVTDESGESRMQNYNQAMTVQELVDVVTFLKSEYPLRTYPKTRYYNYYPRDTDTGG